MSESTFSHLLLWNPGLGCVTFHDVGGNGGKDKGGILFGGDTVWCAFQIELKASYLDKGMEFRVQGMEVAPSPAGKGKQVCRLLQASPGPLIRNCPGSLTFPL